MYLIILIPIILTIYSLFILYRIKTNIIRIYGFLFGAFILNKLLGNNFHGFGSPIWIIEVHLGLFVFMLMVLVLFIRQMK